MKARMMVVSNSEEIAEARAKASQEEGVKIPEKKMKYTDLLFDPNNVSLAYIDTDGGIRIIYNGQDLSLEHDDDLFKKLEENFNNRN